MSNELYVGVDVSKDMLDVNWGKAKTFKNSPSGIRKLVNVLTKVGATLVVVESTGGYERALMVALFTAEVPVALVNPRRTKAFALSLGLEAKTDKIDAGMLRLYGERIKPQAHVPPSKEVEKLQFLLDRRGQLMTMLVAEKNRRKNPLGCPETKRSIRKSISFLIKEIRIIDSQAKSIIEGSERLSLIAKTVQKEKGVGPVLTFALLSELPELGTLNRKEVAALTGVAPFDRQSGTSIKARTTRGGRKLLRTTLYMATVCGIRRNQWLKSFYLSLVKRGKKKMVALVATMRKFIVRLNSLVRSLRLENQAIALATA